MTDSRLVTRKDFIKLALLGIVGFSLPARAASLSLEDCVRQISTQAIHQVGERGGKYPPEPPALRLGSLPEIPYYYSEGKSYIPPIEKIQQNIAQVIRDSLALCPEVPWQKPSTPPVLVALNPGKAVIQINYVKMDSTPSSTMLEIPSPFYDMYQHALNVLKTYTETKHPGYACLSCINELNGKSGFKTEIGSLRDGTDVITIKSDKYPLQFRFAVNSSVPKTLNKLPYH